MSNPAGIQSFAEVLTKEYPALNVLINNAGIMRPENLLGQPDYLADAEAMVLTNLLGPIRLTAALLPLLRKQTRATIMNVSSGLAFVPLPIAPVYSATKAALHAYTQSLRVQLHGTGVTVVELAPPGVETPLFRGEFAHEFKGQKAMDVKDLASKTIAAIEKGTLEIRPGIANLLKVMSRIAPGFMLRQMSGLAKRSV